MRTSCCLATRALAGASVKGRHSSVFAWQRLVLPAVLSRTSSHSSFAVIKNNNNNNNPKVITIVLHSLAGPYGSSTSSADYAGQQPVWPCFFSIVLDGMIQVLEFFVSYPSQGADELAELGPHLVALGLPLFEHLKQDPDLIVVVLSNLGLDSLGACHGGLAPHDGRGPAESRGHHRPQGV